VCNSVLYSSYSANFVYEFSCNIRLYIRPVILIIIALNYDKERFTSIGGVSVCPFVCHVCPSHADIVKINNRRIVRFSQTGTQGLLFFVTLGPRRTRLSTGALHFTASEVSADEITAPISPHRTSPPAKFTAFALHRRQITPPCKSPP